jgi:predicted RNA-binding Zn-ribbon protein involved in translation (DUF1610 family)
MQDVISRIHDLIMVNLPPGTKRSPSGWTSFNCPMCTDRRSRGGVKLTGESIGYNCFNCGYRAMYTPGPILSHKFRNLAEALGATRKDIHECQLLLMKYGNDLDSGTYAETQTTRYEPKPLPDNAVPLEYLDKTHELRKYAEERGVMGIYPLYHIPGLHTKRRLIIPFYYDGQVIGWSGRHINPPNKDTPKYLHENLNKSFVFNIDENLHKEIVIVNEGFFDAIVTSGVCTMGDTIGEVQGKIISNLAPRIILCPDKDKDGVEMINQAVALGWEVSFPPWKTGIKDACEAAKTYGRLATVASIIEYAEKNPVKIKVKSKFLR